MKVLYLYYNQQDAIDKLKQLYENCDIDFIIIDDGSKIPLKCDWATVYRIEKDIPWNQPAANNLGFSKIPGETVLRMDIDHWFTVEDLKKVAEIELKEKEIVKFERLYKGVRIKEGKNIYLARVDDIVKIGGYNEIFCGNYGFEDGDLMQRMKKGKFKITISDILCRVDGQLYTKGLNRNTDINREKFKKLHGN